MDQPEVQWLSGMSFITTAITAIAYRLSFALGVSVMYFTSHILSSQSLALDVMTKCS